MLYYYMHVHVYLVPQLKRKLAEQEMEFVTLKQQQVLQYNNYVYINIYRMYMMACFDVT